MKWLLLVLVFSVAAQSAEKASSWHSVTSEASVDTGEFVVPEGDELGAGYTQAVQYEYESGAVAALIRKAAADQVMSEYPWKSWMKIMKLPSEKLNTIARYYQTDRVRGYFHEKIRFMVPLDSKSKLSPLTRAKNKRLKKFPTNDALVAYGHLVCKDTNVAKRTYVAKDCDPGWLTQGWCSTAVFYVCGAKETALEERPEFNPPN